MLEKMAAHRHGPSPAMVLFDIDGTLIRRAGPHHREALVEAVRHVTGLETTTEHIPVQGMLDPKILEMMLSDAGAKAARIRAWMPELVEAAERIYVRKCPGSLAKFVCPGVRGLLHRLERRRIPMGLVTGNLTRIGWTKMERAGLKRHFLFGAFAEQAPDRAGLVRIALGRPRRASQVWLVGDHQNDVRAAQANGIRSLAVATGLSSRDELAACAPDLVVDDLRTLRMETLFGS